MEVERRVAMWDGVLVVDCERIWLTTEGRLATFSAPPSTSAGPCDGVARRGNVRGMSFVCMSMCRSANEHMQKIVRMWCVYVHVHVHVCVCACACV